MRAGKGLCSHSSRLHLKGEESPPRWASRSVPLPPQRDIKKCHKKGERAPAECGKGPAKQYWGGRPIKKWEREGLPLSLYIQRPRFVRTRGREGGKQQHRRLQKERKRKNSPRNFPREGHKEANGQPTETRVRAAEAKRKLREQRQRYTQRRENREKETAPPPSLGGGANERAFLPIPPPTLSSLRQVEHKREREEREKCVSLFSS